MKKTKTGLIGLVAVMVALVTLGLAPVLAGQGYMRPLGVEEAALYGASHVWTIEYNDFTASTTTNSTAWLTNTVAANSMVELRAYVLDKAFDDENSSWTNSTVMYVGDGSTTNLFLEATQIASDGTEVFVKYPTPDAYTISVSAQTVAITGTNVMTNATATATASEQGRKLYTTAGSIVAGFTPMSMEAMASQTVGRVQLYFRVIKPSP